MVGGFLHALLGMRTTSALCGVVEKGVHFLGVGIAAPPCGVCCFQSVTPMGAQATCSVVYCELVCVCVCTCDVLRRSLYLLFSLSWLTLCLQTLCWNNSDLFSNVFPKLMLSVIHTSLLVLAYKTFCICNLQLYILKVVAVGTVDAIVAMFVIVESGLLQQLMVEQQRLRRPLSLLLWTG